MTDTSHSVVIVGTGNVATHLAERLHERNVRIHKVVGRSAGHAQALANRVDTQAMKLDDFTSESDSIPTILAVSDDAIAPLSAQLKHRFLMHTSGSVPMSALASGRQAVLYPLQTFTVGRKVKWSDLPVCIEGSSVAEQLVVSELANRLSNAVYAVDSEQRRVLHLAAVVMNNFVNYLYGLSAGYLEQRDLTFEMLRPLMRETASKAMEIAPEQAQTGPARRNDRSTIDRHLEMLREHPELREVYRLLTQQITKKYHG